MVLVAALSLTNCKEHSLSWAIHEDKPVITTCAASGNGTMFGTVELHGNIVWCGLQTINDKVKTQDTKSTQSTTFPDTTTWIKQQAIMLYLIQGCNSSNVEI